MTTEPTPTNLPPTVPPTPEPTPPAPTPTPPPPEPAPPVDDRDARLSRAQEVLKAHGIDYDLAKADLGQPYVKPAEPPITPPAPAPKPPEKDNAITAETLAAMSEKEINDRWTEVEAFLNSEKKPTS